MIVVLIRHAQSMNNCLEETSPELYDSKRQDDPEISAKGVSQIKALGEFFKTKGIVFDQYFSSPHCRSLMSTKVLFEVMGKPLKDVEILVPIHEFGGCNMHCRGFPGKSRSFVEFFVSPLRLVVL